MANLKRCLIPEIQNGLGDSLFLYSQALKELESTYGLLSLISRTYLQSVIQLQRVNQNDHKAHKRRNAAKTIVASRTIHSFTTLQASLRLQPVKPSPY